MAIGIITLLTGLVLAVVSYARKESQSVRCISNLRYIGNAFQHYVLDNGRFYPNPDASVPAVSWESVLYDAGYINDADIFRCPADAVVFTNTKSSYDWRDTPNIATTLAGRALTDVKRGDFVVVFEAFPEFHRKKHMNAVRFDGSAESMNVSDCLKDLQTPIRDQSSPSSPGGPGSLLNGN